MFTLSPRLAEHVDQLDRTVRHHCSNAKVNLTVLNKSVQDSNIEPKAILYAALLFGVCVWLAVTFTRHIRQRRRQALTPPSTPNLEKRSPFKAPDRPPGGTEPPIIHLIHHLESQPSHQ